MDYWGLKVLLEPKVLGAQGATGAQGAAEGATGCSRCTQGATGAQGASAGAKGTGCSGCYWCSRVLKVLLGPKATGHRVLLPMVIKELLEHKVMVLLEFKDITPSGCSRSSGAQGATNWNRRCYWW